jgi:hypothetical protein
MSNAKTVQYRYQNTIIETVYDLEGTHPIPAKDGVVTLKGKRHKIINVNFTSGAKGEIPVFDVVAEEME